jgi:hypothetical protein
MTSPKLISLVLLVNACSAICAESANRPDLERLLNDSAALHTLLIRYQPNTTEVLFVYGTGRVVKQAHQMTASDALVPTCTGKITETEVRGLLKTFIDHRFLDLPSKSYVLLFASDDVDEAWKALKLHSITIDDGRVRATRDFAEGEYEGKTDPLPADFVAIESALKASSRKR